MQKTLRTTFNGVTNEAIEIETSILRTVRIHYPLSFEGLEENTQKAGWVINVIFVHAEHNSHKKRCTVLFPHFCFPFSFLCRIVRGETSKRLHRETAVFLFGFVFYFFGRGER